MGCPFNNFGARGIWEDEAKSRTAPTATAMGLVTKLASRK